MVCCHSLLLHPNFWGSMRPTWVYFMTRSTEVLSVLLKEMGRISDFFPWSYTKSIIPPGKYMAGHSHFYWCVMAPQNYSPPKMIVASHLLSLRCSQGLYLLGIAAASMHWQGISWGKVPPSFRWQLDYFIVKMKTLWFMSVGFLQAIFLL